jgi:hypothetical protein
VVSSRRSVAAFIANWLEQQGGFPLFTVEGKWDIVTAVHHRDFKNITLSYCHVPGTGDEPEPADLSWNLPRFINKVASTSVWQTVGLPSVHDEGFKRSDAPDDEDGR